ncbi:hypothetical protein MRX96_005024 [Rhipicephalus microplus]
MFVDTQRYQNSGDAPQGSGVAKASKGKPRGEGGEKVSKSRRNSRTAAEEKRFKMVMARVLTSTSASKELRVEWSDSAALYVTCRKATESRSVSDGSTPS